MCNAYSWVECNLILSYYWCLCIKLERVMKINNTNKNIADYVIFISALKQSLL